VINWVELSVFIFLTVLFFALVYDSLRLRFNLQKMSRKMVQQRIDYDSIVVKLQEALKESDTKNVESKEGFIKFLTDSRDWAFQYIENVQSAIDKLNEESVKVDFNASYLLPEEVESLHDAILKILEQIPEDSQND
jgi:malate synthase